MIFVSKKGWRASCSALLSTEPLNAIKVKGFISLGQALSNRDVFKSHVGKGSILCLQIYCSTLYPSFLVHIQSELYAILEIIWLIRHSFPTAVAKYMFSGIVQKMCHHSQNVIVSDNNKIIIKYIVLWSS